MGKRWCFAPVSACLSFHWFRRVTETASTKQTQVFYSHRARTETVLSKGPDSKLELAKHANVCVRPTINKLGTRALSLVFRSRGCTVIYSYVAELKAFTSRNLCFTTNLAWFSAELSLPLPLSLHL